LKNAYALEVEKCANLSKELSICNNSISCLRDENANLISKIDKLNVCNDSISSLRIENDKLNAKIEELNVFKASTSTVENVAICNRCRDVNIEAIDDHLAMIKQQNDHIATLNAKIVDHELENEKFKFARSMLYNRRRPGIKDGIGFQQGNQSNVKLNAPKRLSNFVKGKAPMVQNSEGYILYPTNYPFDASFVLTNKSGKVVAKYVGGKHKSPKTCVWVPKVLVSNVKGPMTVWVPKNKA
jgi:hypothetical protein